MAIDLLKYMIWRNGAGGGGAGYEKTVGPAPIISVADAKAKPAKSLIVGMEPIQDLHGYDSPWPAGGGKQLLNPALFELETSSVDVTAVVNDDGTISLSGTATANKYLTVIPYKSLSDYGFIEANVSLTLTGYVNDNVYVIFGIYGSGTDYRATSASGVAMTFTEEQIAANRYRLVIYIANGQNCDGITVKPMICKTASPNPTVFAPYENLCPITGRTGVTVERTGVNLFDKESIKNIITEHDYQNGAYYCDYIELAPNTTVTVSYNAGETSNVIILLNDIEQVNGANYFDLRPASGSKTFTTDASGRLYIGVLLSETDASFNARIDACNIQIELGSTASDYSVYSGTSYPVTWQDEAGTVYGGTVDLVSGEGTITWARTLINANWGWNRSTTYLGGFYSAQSATLGYKLLTPFLCSHAKTATSISEYVEGTCFCDSSLNFRLMPTDGSATVKDWKAYIDAQEQAGTPVEICYELATPLTYQLTPTQIQMLKGANVLWSDADDLTLTYLAKKETQSLGNFTPLLFGGLNLGNALNDTIQETPPETVVDSVDGDSNEEE